MVSRRLRYWILLVNHHGDDTWILPEGDTRTYEIAPNNDVRKGDIVYLWWNPHTCFYGWGEVAETPHVTLVEQPLPNRDIVKRKRMFVVVNRKKELHPYITAERMKRDRHLKKFIPTGLDDLYALPLQTVQAHYLNDYITEHNLEAPQGSAIVSWIAQDDAPQINLNAEIIVLGDKTSEGRLVEGVRTAWHEIIRYFGKHPEELFNIDPRKFEELIAGAWELDGYIVELTERSNDKGKDVIATRPGYGSIRIFDQVKRYKISRPVTANDVRALLGTIEGAGNVSKGVFTTTSHFAPNLLDDPVIARAIPHRLELKPREVLLPWLGLVAKGKK